MSAIIPIGNAPGAVLPKIISPGVSVLPQKPVPCGSQIRVEV